MASSIKSMKAPRKYEKRTHYRGTARPGRRVTLGYRPLESDAELSAATTRNLGVGGAFILCDDPLPIGTELYVELEIPTADESIAVDAEVRWLVPRGDEHDNPGMGVQFLDVSVDALLQLSEYFASLTGQELDGE